MAKNLETICIHGGWKAKKGEPQQLPIYQSTTFRYETSDQMARLFDLKDEGYFYTRLQNPTNDFVAKKICELEGGYAAMLTSSGQAANFYAMFNIQRLSICVVFLPQLVFVHAFIGHLYNIRN